MPPGIRTRQGRGAPGSQPTGSGVGYLGGMSQNQAKAWINRRQLSGMRGAEPTVTSNRKSRRDEKPEKDRRNWIQQWISAWRQAQQQTHPAGVQPAWRQAQAPEQQGYQGQYPGPGSQRQSGRSAGPYSLARSPYAKRQNYSPQVPAGDDTYYDQPQGPAYDQGGYAPSYGGYGGGGYRGGGGGGGGGGYGGSYNPNSYLPDWLARMAQWNT